MENGRSAARGVLPAALAQCTSNVSGANDLPFQFHKCSQVDMPARLGIRIIEELEVSMLRFYFTGAHVQGGTRWFMKKQILKTILAGGFLIGIVFLLWASRSSAQIANAQGATISGTVTANREYALSEASGKHIPALYAVRV